MTKIEVVLGALDSGIATAILALHAVVTRKVSCAMAVVRLIKESSPSSKRGPNLVMLTFGRPSVF